MKIYQKKINIQLEKDRITAKKALNGGNKQYGHCFQFFNSCEKLHIFVNIFAIAYCNMSESR